MKMRTSKHTLKTALYVGLSGAALAGWVTAAAQQNPGSLQNPFYGSITAHPATDAVVELSLDDAVRRGFETNLGLKEAEAGETTLHGEELEALQEFLPTITVSGGTGVHEYDLAAMGFGPSVIKKFSAFFPPTLNPSSLSLITKADVTNGQVNYDQTLYSGPVINGYKAIRAAEKVAYFQKMTARGEVVQQVATAYLRVIAAGSDVDNQRALLNEDRLLLEQTEAKHAAGTLARVDELRAQVEFQQQQQRVLASENTRDKAEILLKREIGIAPGQKIQLTDPAPYSDLADRSEQELLTVAYQNRQDYQNLQAQAKANYYVMKARQSERLPTLRFSGNYGVTSVSGVGSHGTLMAMGKLQVPLFREASLRGESDVARAQLDGVERQLADLRVKIVEQVRTAQMDAHAAEKLLEVARSNVDLARQALADETDRYKAGVDDTLPLVRAQAELASAERNLVQSLYQYNLTKLALARSTGVIELQYRNYLGEK
jgi:outer membrane protein TolC